MTKEIYTLKGEVCDVERQTSVVFVHFCPLFVSVCYHCCLQQILISVLQGNKHLPVKWLQCHWARTAWPNSTDGLFCFAHWAYS